jgi:hypothetical protein
MQVECTAMSTRASRGAAAAILVAAAVVGFSGGVIAGNAVGSEDPNAAGGSESSASPAASQSPSDTEPAAAITLSAAKTAFATNEKIDLTGVLEPAAEGVELKVERSLNGSDWDSFPDPEDQVTAKTKNDGTFSTFVQTGREGENQFRVVGLVGEVSIESEPVVVTVG